MYYTDNTLQPISEFAAYTAPDGTQYSATYPKNLIPGLQAITPAPPPTNPSVIITGFGVHLVGGVPTQLWFTMPIPPLTPAQIADVIAESATALAVNKAKTLSAAGNTAAALKILLKLQ